MKKSIILLLAITLVACNNKKAETETTVVGDPIKIVKPAQPKDHSQLIVPGRSVGKIMLGNPTETLSVLEKPDFSDGAMGKAWLVWYDKTDTSSKQTKLMIYTSYKDSELKEKVIAEIRINSGEYKTESGIGAGTSFEVIQKEFPKMKEFAKYKDQRLKKDIFIYDAEGSGIAFEFLSYEGDYAKCVAVIVYPKDKKLNTDYIMNLPERELPGGE